MAKQKEARPEEFYKSQIRNLKKENDQLRKRIRQLESNPQSEKQPRLGQRLIKGLKEAIEIEKGFCPSCGKGTLEQLEFVGRIFDTCNICSYRSKARRVFKRKK